MAVSPNFHAFVLEQLQRGMPVTSRRMFGGVGVYSEGRFFALIDDDRLYLKVDDTNRADFEQAGMGPFRPFGDERAMQYYEVPAEVLEEADELHRWAERAIDAAQRAKK